MRYMRKYLIYCLQNLKKGYNETRTNEKPTGKNEKMK